MYIIFFFISLVVLAFVIHFFFIRTKMSSIGILYVETDWDFAFKIAGKVYASNEQDVIVNNIQDLKDIEYLGPWGDTWDNKVKDYELREGVEKIIKSPNEHHVMLGGNRGFEWTPFKKV